MHTGVIIRLVNDGIEFWIDCFDLADRILDEFGWRDLPRADQFSQSDSIVTGEIAPWRGHTSLTGYGHALPHDSSTTPADGRPTAGQARLL